MVLSHFHYSCTFLQESFPIVFGGKLFVRYRPSETNSTGQSDEERTSKPSTAGPEL